MEWCQALFVRAKAEEVRETRARRTSVQEEAGAINTPTITRKRKRMSHTQPELPAHRLAPPRADHHLVRSEGKPRTCTYCAYLYALAKGAGGTLPKKSKTRMLCFACGDYLCKDHVECFHDTGVGPVEAV